MEQRRRLELFGPDLSRGPFTSASPPVAAVQIAALLAQSRTPLTRSDADIEAHADFIRALADRLMPDFSQGIHFSLAPEVDDCIDTLIREDSGQRSLLHCWLADTVGGGEAENSPDDIQWLSGTVLSNVTYSRRYLIIAPETGVVSVRVKYSDNRTWYWAVERNGRIYYSPAVNFD